MAGLWARYGIWIRRILAYSCLIYLAYYFWKNWTQLGILFEFNWWQTVIITICLIFFNFVYAFRLQHTFKRSAGVLVDFVTWLKLTVLGRFLNHFVPQLGNVYRSMTLKKRFQITHATYASSFAGFIWLDTCSNLLLVILAFHLLGLEISLWGMPLIYLLYLCLSGLAIVPLILPVFSKINISDSRRWIYWFKGRFDEASSVIMTLIRSPVYLFNFFLFALISSALTMLIFWCIFAGLGIKVTVLELLIFNLVHRLASTIVITPGNLGLRELIFGALSASFSLGLASGAIVSGVLRVTSFAILVAMGYGLGGRELLRQKSKFLI